MNACDSADVRKKYESLPDQHKSYRQLTEAEREAVAKNWHCLSDQSFQKKYGVAKDKITWAEKWYATHKKLQRRREAERLDDGSSRKHIFDIPKIVSKKEAGEIAEESAISKEISSVPGTLAAEQVETQTALYDDDRDVVMQGASPLQHSRTDYIEISAEAQQELIELSSEDEGDITITASRKAEPISIPSDHEDNEDLAITKTNKAVIIISSDDSNDGVDSGVALRKRREMEKSSATTAVDGMDMSAQVANTNGAVFTLTEEQREEMERRREIAREKGRAMCAEAQRKVAEEEPCTAYLEHYGALWEDVVVDEDQMP